MVEPLNPTPTPSASLEKPKTHPLIYRSWLTVPILFFISVIVYLLNPVINLESPLLAKTLQYLGGFSMFLAIHSSIKTHGLKIPLQELIEIEKRYQAFFEKSIDALMVTSPDGRIEAVNPAACQMFGMTESEIIQGGQDGVIDHSDSRFIPALAECAQTGRFKGELNFKHKDGTILTGEVSTAFFTDRTGLTKTVMIIRDISDYKKAIEALRESEARFRAVLENSLDAAYRRNLQTDRYDYMSPVVERILGYTAAEMNAMTTSEVVEKIHPDDQPQIDRALALANSTGNGLLEYRFRRKDGIYCWLGDCITVITDETGKPHYRLGMIRDISESKRSNEQKVINILESISDCFYAVDYHWRFTYLNKGAERLFKKTREELLGKTIWSAYPDADSESIYPHFNSALSKKIPVTFEIAVTNSNLWYEYHVYPGKDGLSVYFRDITPQIKYEEALAKERELLMVTLNSLTEGVIVIDSQHQVFLMNNAAMDLTGYSRTEAFRKQINKILYIINDKTSEPIEATALNSELHQKIPENLILVNRNFQEIPVSLHCSSLKSSQDLITGTVIVVTNITEKQKADQELLKAEKFESLSIMAGGIAHDFNNLLAAILSNIQLAQLKYRKNEDINSYLNQCMESTYNASNLTKQLLTFSKGGLPLKKTASLLELIRETAVFALHGSRVKAEFNISDTLWSAEVDAGQISQVIHNLVLNAKQSMPKGGIIIISAQNMTIHHSSEFRPDHYVKISIQDEGIGISKENLSKIFDPFFTTKKDGSGLGLATSFSIIKQHNGYINVHSEVGVGTVFEIYLPALPDVTVPLNSIPEINASGMGLKILLMDDEAIILKTVGEMLELLGHQLILVNDGIQAIQYYQDEFKKGVPFDIVILDLTVPGGMGAQEVIAHLRDIDPKIKAIVSSGYTNDPIMSDYERFGFGGVVTKPYKLDELNQVLNEIIKEKQLLS